MAYYDYLNIPNASAVPGMNYWNGYDYYNIAGEMPQPPMPPHPEPPPVVCPQPKEDYYTYPANLDEALKLIEKEKAMQE